MRTTLTIVSEQAYLEAEPKSPDWNALLHKEIVSVGDATGVKPAMRLLDDLCKIKQAGVYRKSVK